MKVIFIIPNQDSGGAQNFFRRLFHEIDGNFSKELMIETHRGNLIKNALYLLKHSFNEKLLIISTVNSNKLGLLVRILNPKILLITRIGNTISAEVEKHSFNFLKHKFFYKCLVIFSNAVIVQSESMKTDFINFFKICSKKIIVINNGINFPRFTFKVPSLNTTKFLLVGNLKKQKGYDIFFRSLEFINTRKNIQFDICGKEEDISKDHLLETYNTFDYIINFHGSVDPTSFYKDADCYILPSIFEGFSNSLIEALSFGLPSIVSNAPGANLEVIKDNLNGLIFNNLDPNDLASKINSYLANKNNFDRQQIISQAKESYCIKIIARKYISLIMEVSCAA